MNLMGLLKSAGKDVQKVGNRAGTIDKGVLAQLNPFDRNQTYDTVVNNRPVLNKSNFVNNQQQPNFYVTPAPNHAPDQTSFGFNPIGPGFNAKDFSVNTPNRIDHSNQFLSNNPNFQIYADKSGNQWYENNKTGSRIPIISQQQNMASEPDNPIVPQQLQSSWMPRGQTVPQQQPLAPQNALKHLLSSGRLGSSI